MDVEASSVRAQAFLKLHNLAHHPAINTRNTVVFFILLWCLSKLCNVIFVFYFRQPRNIHLASYPTFFGKCLTSVLSMKVGPDLVSQAYKKTGGDPFAIPTFSNYHVYISKPEHIKDLNNAPGQHLSFNGVLADTVYPQYTMHGYSYDAKDPQNTWSVATLKTGFQANLPNMRPALQRILVKVLGDEIRGPSADGWKSITPSFLCHKVACSLNVFMILGEDLSKEPSIVKAASTYARDAVITSEVLQRLPSILHPLVGNILIRWSGATRRLELCITSLVKSRLVKEGRKQNSNVSLDTSKPTDLVQWMIDSPRRATNSMELGIVQRILGFILGAAYQMPMLMTFALYRIARHPEYVEPLRQEINSMSTLEEVSSNTKQDTPFLDSFLKETARLHSLTSGTADRKVTSKPFMFSDGTYVPAGNYIRIAQDPLMKDENNYVKPEEFDGFRFVAKDDDTTRSQSRFCQPDSKFPFWGSTGRACPGRFYAAMLTKMLIIHILTHFDIKLANNSRSSFFWGNNIAPNPWLKILLRPRSSGAEGSGTLPDQVPDVLIQEPPSIPHAIPFFGHVFGLLWHKTIYYSKIAKKHPLPIYKLAMPGSSMYVVTSPELITAVQKSKTLVMAPLEAKLARRLLQPSAKGGQMMTDNTDTTSGESVLYSEGIEAIHAALLPGIGLDKMNRIAVRDLAASCDRLSTQLQSAASSTLKINMMQWVRHEITLATTNAVYGPLNPFKDKKVEDAYWDFERNVGMLLINILPSLTCREGYLGRATVTEAFQEYYSKHGEESASMLVRSRYDICIRHELPLEDMAKFEVGGVLATTVNTVPAAFWMLFNVYSNPDILELLREEVSTILQTRAISGIQPELVERTINITALKTDCPLLTSTFQESLRHSSLGSSVRVAVEDTVIKGQYLLKKNSIIQMPAHVVHFNNAIWGASVADFQASRFMASKTRKISNSEENVQKKEENKKKSVPPGASRSFGGGKNLCPGRHFAATEIMALVVMIIMRFDFVDVTTNGSWKMPESENSNIVSAIKEPDEDIEVEVRQRKGFEGGKWAFWLEESDLAFEIDQAE